ncbi:hypothetical protein LshimejAT787_0311550 [Lyophyllum shimeji]|uniref:Uncharacterized protein n=1 Tax=Lyophyllum shimeji TaxID=47721 RepID=A0A9P3PJ20_LYOSH|nr:hypothetical protein LshimejAT787_0311550 [Lyophyllum shimeji]
MSTNTTNTNATDDGQRAGGGTGQGATSGQAGATDRMKGAYELVHGIGEAIRGGALSAVDSLAHSKSAKENELIEHRGRLEAEQGLAKLKGNLTSGASSQSAHSSNPDGAGQASTQAQTQTSPHDYPPTAASRARPHGVVGGEQGDTSRTQGVHLGQGGVPSADVGTVQGHHGGGRPGPGVARLGLAGAGAEQPNQPARGEEIGACGQGGQSYHTHSNYQSGGDAVGSTGGGPHHHRDDAVTDLNADVGLDDRARRDRGGEFEPSSIPSYDRNVRFDQAPGGGPTEVRGAPGRGPRVEDTNAERSAAVHQRGIYTSANQMVSPQERYGTSSSSRGSNRPAEQTTQQMNAPYQQQTFGAEQYPPSHQHKPYPHEVGQRQTGEGVQRPDAGPVGGAPVE